MQRPSIRADQVNTFAADGVVCLRGSLDPDEVAAMAEPVERARRGPDRRPRRAE